MRKRILSRIGYALTFYLLVLSLIHYHFVYNPNHVSFNEFLSSPQSYAGVRDSFMGPYSHSTAEGFVMLYNHHQITIHYNQEYSPPHFGEVLVHGILNGDGSVTALGVHNYNYNYFIYVVSFFAGVMVIMYFFTEWKITRRGFIHA